MFIIFIFFFVSFPFDHRSRDPFGPRPFMQTSKRIINDEQSNTFVLFNTNNKDHWMLVRWHNINRAFATVAVATHRKQQ